MGDEALFATLPDGRSVRLADSLVQHFTPWLDLRHPITFTGRHVRWILAYALALAKSGDEAAANSLRDISRCIRPHGSVTVYLRRSARGA